MAKSALKYLTNRLIRATMLSKSEPLVTKIKSIGERLFDGDKIPTMIIVIDHEDMGVALNQTRLWALISVLGEDYERWVGETIKLHQGVAQYSGAIVPAIVLTPVPRDQITSRMTPPPPPAIEHEAEAEAEDYVERTLADDWSDEIPF
jgi:hypothetical protein